MRSKLGFVLAVCAGSFGIAVFAPGCKDGVSVKSVCEDICSCGSGCSGAESSGSSEDECVQSGESAQQQSEDVGCHDEFFGYLQCVSDHFECVEGSPSVPACNAAAAAYSDCMSKVTPQPG